MQLLDYFTANQIQKTLESYEHHKHHKLYKPMMDNLIIKDILFHKKQFAQALSHDLRKEQFIYPTIQGLVKIKNHKERPVFQVTGSSYIIQSMLMNILHKGYDKKLSDQLYSYRKGRHARHAVQHLAARIRHRTSAKQAISDHYVYQSDIRDYAGTIATHPESYLWKKVHQILKACGFADLTPYEQHLVHGAIAPTICPTSKAQRPRDYGLTQGLPLVNWVCNIYLDHLDHQLSDIPNVDYIRYCDDILLISPCMDHLDASIAVLQSGLASLGLSIHPEKEKRIFLTRAGRPCDQPNYIGSSRIALLGYHIEANGNISPGRRKMKKFIAKIRHRIHTINHAFHQEPERIRCQLICQGVNALLGLESSPMPIFVARFFSITNDVNRFKELDFLIAYEIAKCLTKNRSIHALRRYPKKHLQQTYGLKSVFRVFKQLNY